MVRGDWESSPPTAWRFIDWLLLLAVLALAAWLRFTHMDPELSFDEIWHLATTQGYGSPLTNYQWNVVYHDVGHMTSLDHAAPVWSIWHDMRGVLHPPLFLIAMRLWRDALGDGEFIAHLFSIVWSLIGITLTFATGRLAINRWAGLLCAATLACAQTQVYLAQEVRAYAMLIALSSFSVWMMTRIEVLGATKRRLVIIAFMTLPLLLTHYFAFGAAIAIGLYGALRAGEWRRTFFAVIAACALVYSAAWVPFAVMQIRDFATGDVMIKMSAPDPTLTTLMLASAPFRLIADRDYQIESLPVLSGVLFLVPWFLIPRMRPLLPWALWLCCSLGAILFLDITRTTRHLMYVRYLAIATPVVPLLFVGTVWSVRQWLAYLVGVAMPMGGLMYLISGNVVLLDAQSYPDVAAAISKHIRPGEPIVSFESCETAAWRAPVLLMVCAHEPDIFPRTTALLSKPMSSQKVDELGSRSLWIIVGGWNTPTESIIPGGRVIESFNCFEEIHVDHVVLDGLAETPGASSGVATGAAPPSR